MGDRVDEFLETLEQEVGDRARLDAARSSLDAAERNARLLIDHLDFLATEGISFGSLTPDDVRAFTDEIHTLAGLDRLHQLTESASALLRLVDNGVVDGDAPRLRQAIERAEIVAATAVAAPDVARRDEEVDPSLVRVRCATCSARVVGRRRPARTWERMAEILSDHSSGAHGGDTAQAEELVKEARSKLRRGVHTVLELGQLAFTVLDLNDSVSSTPDDGDGASSPTSLGRSMAAATRASGRPVKAFHGRAAQWRALPIGTRFARRSDPSITGEIVEDHGFLVQGHLYPFTGRGAPLSAAGGDISGTSENGWLTWVRIEE